MNDSSFSSDSYLCFQDLSASHLSEQLTEQPNAFNFFNSITNGLQAQQQQQSVHHLQYQQIATVQQSSQQSNHVHQTVPHVNNNSAPNNSSSNNNHNITNINNSTLNSLPFVQIHTTDVHPQRSSYGNVFRRNPTNQDVIKSEPIKSESAENNTKDHANTTPTPPTAQNCGSGRSSATSERLLETSNRSICGNEQLAVLHVQHDGISNISSHKSNDSQTTNAKNSIPRIYKCSQCAFICLSESGFQQHTDTSHSSNEYFPADCQQRISCPGCANQFYAQNSFFVHLCEDHRMCPDEANRLLQAFVQPLPYADNSQSQNHEKHDAADDNAANEVQPKIFLKNVECLREPQPRVLDEQLLQLNDSNYFQMTDFDEGCSALLTEVAAADSDYLGLMTNGAAKDLTLDVNLNSQKLQNPPKQKISIKSVDVLREPALVRRDFELQHLNILSVEDQCSEHDLNNVLDADNQFNYSTVVPLELEQENLESKEISAFEKPRRPKIYIKNVDILKEPLVLPSSLNVDFNFITQSMQQQNTGSFMGNSNSEVIATQTQSFDSESPSLICIGSLGEVPMLYDGANNNNFLQNISELDSYNNNNNFLLASPKYQSELQTLNTNHGTNTTPTPIVTDPTPPPRPLPELQQNLQHEYQAATTMQQQYQEQKQKIFIKNADILKQPQFQEHRRTLHLRTVDELNLMNKTEVENLIAPNLDAAQNPTLTQNYNENNINNLNASAENSKNSEETSSYSSLNLKINESDDAQTLHNWTSGYSLGAELDCIITEQTQAISMGADTEMALQKQLYDLETPQMSVISILDMGDLTDEQLTSRNDTNGMQVLNSTTQEQHHAMFSSHSVDLLDSTTTHLEADAAAAVATKQSNEHYINEDMVEIPHELKREQISSINNSETCTPVTEKPEFDYPRASTSPELSETAATLTTFPQNISTAAFGNNSPMSPAQQNLQANQPEKPEKGRIYVADNLMEVTAEKHDTVAANPVVVSITGGTSNRGRPFGSNRTGITKMRKLYGNAAAIDVGMKCNVQGCAFRFRKSETLEYHKRCHSSSTSTTQLMICPECQSSNFSNWNTLHTHLWRTHQIDMELYSCELCSFKTPIYSRLINTHSKIHSEERNYKCDQCEKAFKNSKQLKNHRRWHRNATTTVATPSTADASIAKPAPLALFRCNDCGAAFSHQKTLREHKCKTNVDSQNEMRCTICERVVSSKSSLKLHMRTHETASRFKCTVCDYKANDHNAFRRHKMTHDKSKMYMCPYCDYKSIQSVTYQKHIQQKHPDLADNIVLKCSFCNFSTINRTLLTIHLAKHSSTEDNSPPSDPKNNAEAMRAVEGGMVSIENTYSETDASTQLQQKNKIKVKSDLVLTDPTKFSKNSDANSVTSLLAHCFDNAIT